MSRMKKLYRKYERWVLIGLVVLLLATFSIAGAAQCGSSGGQTSYHMGGSFKVSPSERKEISDEEFDAILVGWAEFQRSLRMPSREFRQYVAGLQPPERFKGTWTHRLAYEAAQAAGYKAGERQITSAVEDMVGFALMFRSRLPFSDVNYQKFLENFRGTQAEFRNGVREIVTTDGFLYPILNATRYQVTYQDAYEEWKQARERVDLQTIALPASPFAAVVRKEETTRSTIGELETSLRNVTTVAASVRRVTAKLDSIHKNTGSYPKTLGDIAGFNVLPDAWKTELRYALVDGKPDVRSAGPDKAFDTADDITLATQKQLDTHGALFELAEKLKVRRTGSGSWPKALKELESSPGGDRLPGLAKTMKDGWDHEFVYTPAAAADGVPTLASMGPDGESGTGDDISLTLDPDEVLVVPGPALASYIPADAKDAWGHALRVVLRRAQPATWRVVSGGADADFATADDNLVSGNQQELRLFFAPIRSDYIEEAKREFETLFVHLPLVTDAALARLWAKYPQHRPTDEEQLFQEWRPYRDVFYKTENPADAETGHGAELVKEIAPDAAAVFVPAKSLFPDKLSKPDAPKKDDEGKDDEGKDDEGKDDEGKDDEPAKDDEAKEDDVDPDAADRALFVDKGWREILIRQRFIENLLDDILKRSRTSAEAVSMAQTALEAWEKTKAANDLALKAWDEKYEGKEVADAPPRPQVFADEKPVVPAEVTFQSILANELADLIASGDENTPPAIQYWKTPKPMTRLEYEANKNFGKGLQFELNRLKVDGAYNNVPAQLRSRLTKVLVRRISHAPQRALEYDEVADKVFDRFVEKRQMDRASKQLKALQEAIIKAEAALGEDASDEAKAAAAAGAIAAAAKTLGAEPLVETSGLFIGNAPPPALAIEDDMSEKEKARAARRNLVWLQGYETVRPTSSLQDTVSAEVGTFGRRVLTDPREEAKTAPDGTVTEARGTGHAYLVRVAARVYPSKHEFSPRRYTQYLSTAVFGSKTRQHKNLRDYKGRFFQALAHWFDDMEWMQSKFDLQTNSEMDVLERRERR